MTKKEQLLEYGFKETGNPLSPFTKDLSENGDLALAITRGRNTVEMIIQTPDGALFLNCNLEQLKIIENAITRYESGY